MYTMETFKKILVPTDFSETAENALRAAMLLAQKEKAAIYLVHFCQKLVELDAIGEPMFQPNEQEVASEHAKDQLLRIKHSARIAYPELHFHVLVNGGFLENEIAGLCKENDIDLIVCGTNGTDWLGEHFLGTNASSMVQVSTIPILVIPQKANFTRLKKIVFSTDFQSADGEILKKIVGLAQNFEASIQAIHISQKLANGAPALALFKEIVQQSNYLDVSYKDLVDGELSSKFLNSYLKNENADLLVMTTTGKNTLERILYGSFTREMVCHSEHPLLIYHLF
jgi:nucleotide-binding universal stress UspA family protein